MGFLKNLCNIPYMVEPKDVVVYGGPIQQKYTEGFSKQDFDKLKEREQ